MVNRDLDKERQNHLRIQKVEKDENQELHRKGGLVGDQLTSEVQRFRYGFRCQKSLPMRRKDRRTVQEAEKILKFRKLLTNQMFFLEQFNALAA